MKVSLLLTALVLSTLVLFLRESFGGIKVAKDGIERQRKILQLRHESKEIRFIKHAPFL